MKKIDFAQRLNLIRDGKTQKDFAELIGVPLTSYTNWLLGISMPKLEHLHKICKVTGTSSDWLLGLSDNRHGGQSASRSEYGAGIAAEPRPSHCAECAAKESRIIKLEDTLHNLSLGRSTPARNSVSAPTKY